MLGDSHVDFGVNAPAYIKGSDIAIFARDPETGKQVWSGEEGYPAMWITLNSISAEVRSNITA
jgi:predicted glycosyl hydrolase (DUF1957 family)